MRTFLQIVISLFILAAAVFFMFKIRTLGDKERPKPKAVIKTVFVDTVQNGTVPIMLEASSRKKVI